METMFFQDNKEFHNRIFVQGENGKACTYYDLKEFSDAIGEKVNRRETVLVICKNSPGTLMGIISFLRNNVIMLLINDKLQKSQIDSLINLYLPNYIFVSEDQVGDYSGFNTAITREGMALLKNNIQMEPVKDDELALMMSTSGSTGSPKFVRLGYSNLEKDTQYINSFAEVREDDACLTVLPLHFLYGLESVFRHIKVGAKIIMTDKSIVQNEFWDLCREYKPTYFFGVPYTYETMRKLGILDYLKQFRALSCSGGKLGFDLVKQVSAIAAENNILFFIEYGSTEAGGVLTIGIKSKAGICEASEDIGDTYEGCTLSPYDENGNEIMESGVQGELVYKGGNVCMGYALCYEDLNKGNEFKGVLRTGDIGTRNENGHIVILGRAKRFIKIYGKRHSLDHIEQSLKAVFSDTGIASTGKDDLLVVFNSGKDMIKEIEKYIHKVYKLSPKNFKVIYIEEFPLNSNGKISYMDLLKLV